MKQKTLKKETVFDGLGLHTGKKVSARVLPGKENTGILFARRDLDPKVRTRASLENVSSDETRQTAVLIGKGVVRTIEHLMATFHGLGIDNAVVEVDGEEVPGMDGSAKDFTEAFLNVGLVEQNADREWLEVTEPVFVDHGDQSIVILPAPHLRVSYTLSYRHEDLDDQFVTLQVMPEIFERELASARTFCLKQEAEYLLAQGFGKGASLGNTLVFEKNQPIENTLRFEDEACRHKIMDLLGDLLLTGKFLRGHVVAVRSGHSLNLELVRQVMSKRKKEHKSPQSSPKVLYSEDIKKIIPHRYPFLFVDRIENFQPGIRATGFKQVSSNDYFFQGHFPGHPVMPGVIIIEAMAQVGGAIMLSEPGNRGKLAYFMSLDDAKFRLPVRPGDELRMEVEVTKKRARTGQCSGKAYVKEKLVCEAVVKFAVVDQ